MHASFVLVTVVLSTGQLCFGLWIGLKLGRMQGQNRLGAKYLRMDEGRAEGGGIEAPRWLGTSHALLHQAQSLSAASASCQPALPDHIISAIAELLEATRLLHQQLNARQDAAESEDAMKPRPEINFAVLPEAPVTPPEEPHAESGRLVLNDLSNFATTRTPALRSRSERRVKAFPYSALEYMAPCGEDELPQHDTFRAVRCHYLSSNGISFLIDEPPDYAFVTISVGTAPNLTFIMSRVRQCRQVRNAQGLQYLVNCEFVRRLLPGELRWQGQREPQSV